MSEADLEHNTYDEPIGQFFMEYNCNICLKNENPRVNDKIHKKDIDEKKSKKSRMIARKIYNVKKHNRKRKRMKLKLDTNAMITDICEYC